MSNIFEKTYKIPAHIKEHSPTIPDTIPFTPWGKLTHLDGDEWQTEDGRILFGGGDINGNYYIKEKW